MSNADVASQYTLKPSECDAFEPQPQKFLIIHSCTFWMKNKQTNNKFSRIKNSKIVIGESSSTFTRQVNNNIAHVVEE